MKHPVFVIEGPDCAGKTTLANELIRILGNVKYIHLTYKFKDKMDKYHTAALLKVLKLSEDYPVILDRWWPSEITYAAAFRGKTKWPSVPRMLDRAAMQYGFFYVFCLPKDRDAYIAHHMEKRPDRYKDKPWALRGREGQEDTMITVFDRYHDVLKWMGSREDVIQYDFMTDGKNMSAFLNQLIFKSGDLSLDLISKIGSNGYYTAGNPNGQMLIIGDKSNPKGRHKTWPFCENANSSLWITQALEANGIAESQLYWLNVNDVEVDPRYLTYLDEQFNYVLALGNNARLATEKYFDPLKYNHCHHPQWYRRFAPGFNNIAKYLAPIKGEYDHEAARNLGLA